VGTSTTRKNKKADNGSWELFGISEQFKRLVGGGVGYSLWDLVKWLFKNSGKKQKGYF
jgi:hypothetical protein